MRQIFAIAFGLAISITGAFAQTSSPKPGSPAANFRDDALLAQAMGEIVQMQRHEIDLLTDALATCSVTSLNDDPAVRRLCEIASARYRTAYGGGRAISSILFAMKLNDSKIMVLDKSGKDEHRAEASKDIMRQVEISGRLSDGGAVSVQEGGGRLRLSVQRPRGRQRSLRPPSSTGRTPQARGARRPG